MSLRHVQSGQPLQIPAGDWNKIIDATRAYYANQGTSRPAVAGPSALPGAYVRNDSGEDQERFAVLGIDEPIITPEDNEDEFKRIFALSCVTPSEADHGVHRGGRFAILLEPLASGAIGRAAVAGVCQVKVDVENEDHAFADVADDVTSSLKSGQSGPAVILWKQTGTGEQWAVVRFGGAAASAATSFIIYSANGDGSFEARPAHPKAAGGRLGHVPDDESSDTVTIYERNGWTVLPNNQGTRPNFGGTGLGGTGFDLCVAECRLESVDINGDGSAFEDRWYFNMPLPRWTVRHHYLGNIGDAGESQLKGGFIKGSTGEEDP